MSCEIKASSSSRINTIAVFEGPDIKPFVLFPVSRQNSFTDRSSLPNWRFSGALLNYKQPPSINLQSTFVGSISSAYSASTLSPCSFPKEPIATPTRKKSATSASSKKGSSGFFRFCKKTVSRLAHPNSSRPSFSKKGVKSKRKGPIKSFFRFFMGRSVSK